VYGFSVIDLEDGEEILVSDPYELYADAKAALISYLEGRADHYAEYGAMEESHAIDEAIKFLMLTDEWAKVYSSTINWKVQIESVDNA